MSALPEYPDLDQLRHQAKELHRAAASGQPAAARRIGLVSARVTLSAAQLALAREYGFSSWAKLKNEVGERRRGRGGPGLVEVPAGASTPARAAVPAEAGPPARTKTWSGWREQTAAMLQARTGHDVDWWNQHAGGRHAADEAAMRAWLNEEGITGYPATLLVWERFGYPGFLTADADELIGCQYADRPQLRPILNAILAALPEIGQVTIQARKTYTSLVSPRRTFAVVQATTRSRVDLGLRLAGQEAGGRLLPAKGVGNGSFTVRIGLRAVQEVDEEAIGWLSLAYAQNAARTDVRPGGRLGGAGG